MASIFDFHLARYQTAKKRYPVIDRSGETVGFVYAEAKADETDVFLCRGEVVEGGAAPLPEAHVYWGMDPSRRWAAETFLKRMVTEGCLEKAA